MNRVQRINYQFKKLGIDCKMKRCVSGYYCSPGMIQRNFDRATVIKANKIIREILNS
jgi:hypothetical protein